MLHKLQVLAINDDLWDRGYGLGGETWKGCEWIELLLFQSHFSEQRK